MNRKWRYKAYFLLVDLLTAVAVINLIQTVAGPLAEGPGFRPDVWHGIVGAITLILPAFLMLARFMRDEFAELCWQKSAATTIKWLFVGPVVLLFALAAARLAGTEMDFVVRLIREGGAAGAITAFLNLLVTVFAFSFQFHRWRGGR